MVTLSLIAIVVTVGWLILHARQQERQRQYDQFLRRRLHHRDDDEAA